MTLNNTSFARNGIILSKHSGNEVLHLFSFVFIRIFLFYFGFELDLLTLYMTLNHQTNNINRFLRQNEILLHLFQIIFP